MSDEILEVACPCCRALLTIDAKTGEVLRHQAPRRQDLPPDLSAAVELLEQEERAREGLFDRQLEAERKHGQALGRRFEGLLKKQRGQPSEPFVRDIDLD